ncbi:hypothetical protein [Bacillus rhizoplanae]|uniref:hypothetical protein n=1 Tax=Bacillus rhizoplanae TaxID=2880966 RepID=UPI003D1ABAC0
MITAKEQSKAVVLDFNDYVQKKDDVGEKRFIDMFEGFYQKQDEMFEMIKSVQDYIKKDSIRGIDVTGEITESSISKQEEYTKGLQHSFNINKDCVDGGTNMLIKPEKLVTLALRPEPFVQDLYSYIDGDVENYVIILKNTSIDITSRLTDIYWELFDEFEEQEPGYLFEFSTRSREHFSINELPSSYKKL